MQNIRNMKKSIHLLRVMSEWLCLHGLFLQNLMVAVNESGQLAVGNTKALGYISPKLYHLGGQS